MDPTGGKSPADDDEDHDDRLIDDDEVDSSTESESSLDDEELPLLYYKRVFGSLPRTTTARNNKNQELSVNCTCSFQGKVVLNHETTVFGGDRGEDGGGDHQGNNNHEILFYQNKPIALSMLGFHDGSVMLVDSSSGSAIEAPVSAAIGSSSSTDGGSIQERQHSPYLYASDLRSKAPIVAVSMDSSGTNLTAIDQEGNCAVWSVRYRLSYSAAQQNKRATKRPSVTTSLAAYLWTGGSSFSGKEEEDPASDERVPTLRFEEIKILKIFYRKIEFGGPTCLCIDPAPTKRVLVSFNTGKLVLTSRNWMRNYEHTILPYTGPVTADDWKGIEALTWRASLIAFADCSGVKLFDMQTLKPVAHVDRPRGAQPSLYGTLPVKPSLCWETSHSLLVAWGDCLMNLKVTDHLLLPSGTTGSGGGSASMAAAAPDGGGGNNGNNNNNLPTRKRTVACTMAWGLDNIVAAGVVPMDERHVAVLGLLDAQVEMQVIDRTNGTVQFSDLLPKMENPQLISSFSIPRMEDFAEARQLGNSADDNIVATMIAGAAVPLSNKPTEFSDLHLQWNLDMVAFPEEYTENYDDDASDDSDDYGFLFRRSSSSSTESSSSSNLKSFVAPPVLWIASSTDVLLVRVRTVDDAVAFALDQLKLPALALKYAITHVRQLERYTIDEVVNKYLRSLLRLDQSGQSLSLRRVRLCADALPILLGGKVNQWELWVSELEKIQGSLFVVRSVLPVRDPKLPMHAYESVLNKMLEEVEDMKQSKDVGERLVLEAEGHFLHSLVGWGSTRTLKEHVKLYETQSAEDRNFELMLRRTKESLAFRRSQTAVGYLDLSPGNAPVVADRRPRHPPANPDLQHGITDCLFDIDKMIASFEKRVSVAQFDDSADNVVPTDPRIDPNDSRDSRVVLDALARLFMMKRTFDKALKCFLIIGALHATNSLQEMEEGAMDIVNKDPADLDEGKLEVRNSYTFLLHFIAEHHLHQYLLEMDFLPEVTKSNPICALIRLVGLRRMGDFLIEYCVAPQQNRRGSNYGGPMYLPTGSSACKTTGERRGTLPLNLVADQLAGSPRLFHWYLHLVLGRKPEVYVKFPNTANPPTVITNLHKKHLDLYIKYAGPNRDSASALARVEAYRVAEKTTPLLSFLKVILQLGAISPLEVGKMLEVERRGGAGVSRIFALELAFIMENYGDNKESDAQLILELYLKGTESLMLAVSYAQRTKTHSKVLWESLISHCLSRSAGPDNTNIDGTLFGSLLEAAALSGSDLSHLVAQIPPGMQVEGLRPRLVAAVADYRLKVRLHETSAEIAAGERDLLLREASQRYRRGMHCDQYTESASSSDATTTTTLLTGGEFLAASGRAAGESDTPIVGQVLPPTLRPRHRPSRYSRSVSIAIR